MTSRLVTLIALPLMASVSGCANLNSQEPTPEQRRLTALETRADRVDRRLENLGLVQVAESVDSVSAELRELRGQIERIRFDLEQAKQRERQLYLELDKRIQRMEQSGVGRLAGSTGSDSQVSTADVASADPEVEQAYIAAFDLLKAGKFDAAIRAFKQFQQAHPDSVYTDNARYWLGEAYYVKREFDDALTAFSALREDFPQSPKVPDAMLKTAYIHYERQEFGDARTLLEAILAQHPDASAARLARQRLDRLDREGR